jgi:hypothetical protein
MLRLLAALVTVPAVVAGLVLAPHSHVHPAGAAPGRDAHHRHVGTVAVKHAHVTPHTAPVFPAVATSDDEVHQDDHEHEDPVALPTGEFVWRVVGSPQSPAPSVLTAVARLVPPTAAVVLPTVFQPPAHGPPEGPPAPSRAPPSPRLLQPEPVSARRVSQFHEVRLPCVSYCLCVWRCAARWWLVPSRRSHSGHARAIADRSGCPRTDDGGRSRVRAFRARFEEVRAEQSERTRWPNPFGRSRANTCGERGRVPRRPAGSPDLRPAWAPAGCGNLRHRRGGRGRHVPDSRAASALRRSFTTLLVACRNARSSCAESVEELRQLIEMLHLREEAGEGVALRPATRAASAVDLESDLAATTIARARARVGARQASSARRSIPSRSW